MSLSNHQLFEMINASPGTSDAWAWLALVLAYGSVWLVPGVFWLLWRRADGAGRHELLVVAAAAVAALVVCELCSAWWPHSRPVALHMGFQLSPWPLKDPGLPSGEVAALIAMGLSTFATRQLAVFGFPLLTLALLAGGSLVFTGEHFPYDVAAAVPVAMLCAVVVCAFERVGGYRQRGWPRI